MPRKKEEVVEGTPVEVTETESVDTKVEEAVKAAAPAAEEKPKVMATASKKETPA